jgi:hypothetical protein
VDCHFLDFHCTSCTESHSSLFLALLQYTHLSYLVNLIVSQMSSNSNSTYCPGKNQVEGKVVASRLIRCVCKSIKNVSLPPLPTQLKFRTKHNTKQLVNTICTMLPLKQLKFRQKQDAKKNSINSQSN